MAHPVDKDALAEETLPMRELFTKSVVTRMDLPAGIELCEEHLAVKENQAPVFRRLSELVGAQLKKSVKADELLHEEDLEYLN